MPESMLGALRIVAARRRVTPAALLKDITGRVDLRRVADDLRGSEDLHAWADADFLATLSLALGVAAGLVMRDDIERCQTKR